MVIERAGLQQGCQVVLDLTITVSDNHTSHEFAEKLGKHLLAAVAVHACTAVAIARTPGHAS